MAKKEVKQTVDFPFGRVNYMWLLIGLGFIFLGFILMSGGGSDDPTFWDENVIFSTRRITIAPLMVIIGFVIEVYAITKKAKD